MVEAEKRRPQEIRVNFSPDLVPLVTSGEKTSTWRVGDEKGIAIGDTLLLQMKGKLKDGKQVEGERPFARATVVSVTEKPFREFTQEDLAGHEQFASTEQMVQTYREYYPEADISLDTPVKIILFELQKSR
jgi:hypothetical protein